VALHVHLSATVSTDLYGVLLSFGLCFLVYLCALPAARILGRVHAPLVLLWAFAVGAASMAVYFSSDLLLSGEVNRYRWDGIVAEAGHNPYEVSPESEDLRALRDAFTEEIPHATRKGLYPPLAELLFYFMARLDMNTLFFYRALFSLATLFAGLAFIPLCRGAQVPPTRVLVFLWHPLLILETAGNAHIEAVAIFFLLTSLSLIINRHHLTPVGSLALSVLIKTYPVALLPLYLRRVPIYRMVLFVLVLVAGSVPFMGAGRELYEGIADYVSHARFNPGVFVLFEELFRILGRPEWTRAAIGFLGVLVAAGLYFTDDGTHASILRRGFYLTLPPLLLGPVLKPWYVLWLIPFLALVGRRNPFRMAFLYLSGSVILSYLHLEWGHIPGWLTALEWGPVPILAVWGYWRSRRLATWAASEREDSDG
jgi:hypothetical protein